MPGRGEDMGDGWETRRRREPGNDWAIVALAQSSTVKKVTIDTAHFKGNYPDSCCILGATLQSLDLCQAESDSEKWAVLLPQVKLSGDAINTFSKEVIDIGPVTHIRLNKFPDGGISRICIDTKI